MLYEVESVVRPFGRQPSAEFMKSKFIKLKYSDFIVIKFTIFGFMAIFGPFIDYLTTEVMSSNLVADIYKVFPI